MANSRQKESSSSFVDAGQSATAFSYFDGDAKVYDESRPRYPEALIARIVAALPGRDILNPGCGTGIEARQFRAAGCTVLGVDPDARMAAFARGPSLEVDVSTFEDWDAYGRMFDAVVSGTSWHWIDPRAGSAKAARVLRPGGLIAPFHHVAHVPPEVAGPTGGGLPAWSSRAADAYQRAAPPSPFDDDGRRKPTMQLYQPLFDTMADAIRQTGAFSEPEQWQFEWTETHARDDWLEQLPTYGAFKKLPPDEAAAALSAVEAEIDRMGGSFEMPYTTVAVVSVRSDSA